MYAVVGAALLAPSIRPGRTVVPTDILEAVEPYRTLPPKIHVHEPAPSDSPFQFLGWWTWMGRELRTGHVPEWNPDILGGVPAEPNGFVSTAYPFTALTRVLAPFDAYNAFVWVHLVIAAMGAYALARRLGARASPAIVGGLGAFGVAMTVHLSTHLTHLVALAWAGLVLAGVHYAVRTPGVRSCVAVAAPLALAWLGGGTQFAYYLSLAAAGYGVLLALVDGDGLKAIATRGARLVAGVVLGLALAAPLLLPTLKASGAILRTSEPVEATVSTHLPGADLLRVVLPQWRHPDGFAWGHTENVEYDVDSPFVGVVVVILALGALALAKNRRDVAATIGALAVVGVLAFIGAPHRVLYAALPGYKHFRVSARWISLVGAFAVPLAAATLSALTSSARPPRRVVLAASAVVAAIAAAPVVLGVLKPHVPARALLSDSLFSIVVALTVAAVVGLGMHRLRRPAALGVIAMLIVVESFAHTTTWYGAHRERGALPALPSLRRVATHGRLIRLSPRLTQLPPIVADVPLAYGLSDASGWAVFLPRDIDAYMNLVEPHGQFAHTTNVEPPLTQAASLTSSLLDALNVSTVLVDPGFTTSLPYPVVGHEGPVRLVARDRPLGPAAFVAAAVPVSSQQEARRQLQVPGVDLGTTSFVQGLAHPLAGGGGSVRLVTETADTQRYSVRATSKSLLRVSGRFDRGWSVRVDGRRAPVLRADGLFRSVVVAAGSHVLTWRYKNPATATGRRIGVAALVCAAGLLLPGRWWRRVRRFAPRAR